MGGIISQKNNNWVKMIRNKMWENRLFGNGLSNNKAFFNWVSCKGDKKIVARTKVHTTSKNGH